MTGKNNYCKQPLAEDEEFQELQEQKSELLIDHRELSEGIDDLEDRLYAVEKGLREINRAIQQFEVKD